jgi:hypothetical protein
MTDAPLLVFVFWPKITLWKRCVGRYMMQNPVNECLSFYDCAVHILES